MMRALGIALGLTVLTVAVYRPVPDFGFVNYDDDLYVSANAHVQRGLTWDGVRWALTTTHSAHWHPVTWLSLMADAEWSGRSPAGYHVTNLLLHIVNTVLLFRLLATLTAAPWPSAWVAALFALHPLHVESVAWIAERKDVLSGLFWLLTLGAYARYVRTGHRGWFGLTTLWLALGLMAKPMGVTLPFVMLLLDVWPLRRRPGTSWGRLVREKLPLFALAGASGWITVVAGQEAQMSLAQVPVGQRLATAVVAGATYLQKMFWPVDLGCLYPHPGHWSWSTVAAAGLVLLGVTLLAIRTRRRAPAVWVGWCWYLGTLVPVSGLVQVGSQAFADRYTYLPLIGVWMAVAWGLVDWTAGRAAARTVLAVAGALTVAACALVSARQVAVWRDSVTLFEHALRVNPANPVAHLNLGEALEARGQAVAAAEHYRAALRLRPDYAEAHFNLANVLAADAATRSEAVRHYTAAIQLQPHYPKAHTNLGNAWLQAGQSTAAERHYREALTQDPGQVEARHNLGMALAAQGRFQEAIPHYDAALRAWPESVDVRLNLARALWGAGQPAAAAVQCREALRLAPHAVDAQTLWEQIRAGTKEVEPPAHSR